MKDVVVIQRLRERGVSFADLEQVLVYESVEHQPRVLDKPPSRLSLVRAEPPYPTYSTFLDFISTYAAMKSDYPLEVGTFDIRGHKRTCDIELFWAAQTLLREGVTAIPDKLRSCAELLQIVFATPSEGHLTKGMVLEKLNQYIVTNYHAGQLLKAIYKTVYEYSDIACDWIEMTEFDRTFTNALLYGVEYLGTVDSTFDLQNFVKTNYAAAKSDPDFMKSVGKAFTSNKTKQAMIAMIYYFRDKPDVLDYGYVMTVK